MKRRVAKKALDKLKRQVKQKPRRNVGRSMQSVIDELREYLLGWKAYFGWAETPGTFDDLDKWIRHRLRALQLKHWRRGRTAYHELRRMGLSDELAAMVASGTRRWWWNASKRLHHALPNSHLASLGLPSLRS